MNAFQEFQDFIHCPLREKIEMTRELFKSSFKIYISIGQTKLGRLRFNDVQNESRGLV